MIDNTINNSKVSSSAQNLLAGIAEFLEGQISRLPKEESAVDKLLREKKEMTAEKDAANKKLYDEYMAEKEKQRQEHEKPTPLLDTAPVEEKKEPKNTWIVKTTISKYLHLKKLSVSDEFLKELEEKLIAVIDVAIKRCKENKRNTIMARDI